MGILKTITNEYFGETVREEDMVNIDGLDVEIVSFTDNNGNVHKRGYKPKDKGNLRELLKRMIEMRGDDGDFNDIDTSDITNMSLLFNGDGTFNGDITGWDVSNVTNMHNMFCFAESFNQPICDWDVSSVESMSEMFCGAKSFNQPIGDWDVSNVKNMSLMFYGAESFNQPIGNWDVSNVTEMINIFKYAKSFNQDLSKWNLNGKKISNIFHDCPIKDEYKPKMN